MKPLQKRKSTKGLKAVCLAAGLCLAAWGSPTPAAALITIDNYYEISGWVTPNNNLSDVYVIVRNGNNGEWFDLIGNIPGGRTSYFSFEVSNGQYDPPPSSYTLLGLYDVNNQNVTVALNTAATINAIGPPGKYWGTVFPSILGDAGEAALADSLISGNKGDLASFFATYYSQFSSMGYGAYLVNFSGGTPGGTTTAVPLPPTLALVLPGLGAMLLLRRRRKSSAP